MADPNRRKSFAAPAWMVEAAKKNASRSNINSAALGERMREVQASTSSSSRAPQASANMFDEDGPQALLDTIDDFAVNSMDITDEHTIVEQNAYPVMPAPAFSNQTTQMSRNRRRESNDDRRARKLKIRADRANGHGVPLMGPPSSISQSPMGSPMLSIESDMGVKKHEYVARASLPAWLTEISEKRFEMKELGKRRSQSHVALESLKESIRICEREFRPDQRDRAVEALRDHVHKAEFLADITKFLVKKTKILTPESGLPRIFQAESKFPPDLRADSYQLYNRWYNEDFEQDILRGIITKKGDNRGGDSIDPEYRIKHPTTAKFYGEGDLVLGQWWPTQLTAVRDGAHGAAQGGKLAPLHLLQPTHPKLTSSHRYLRRQRQRRIQHRPLLGLRV